MKSQSVVFVVGTDATHLRFTIEELRKKLLDGKAPSPDDSVLDLKTTQLTEVFDLANTFPMWGGKRLLTLRNVAEFNEKDQTHWLGYLENPSPHTILLALVEKLDKRTKLFKKLDQLGALVEIGSPTVREMGPWIDKLATLHEVTVSPGARRALIDAIGANLGTLEQEIQKLALYVHPKTEIDEKSVATLVLRAAEENLFAWADQVVESRLKDALLSTRRLLADGTPALVLISILARHLRVLLKAIEFQKGNSDRSGLAPALGVPPFAVNRYVEQARRFSGLRVRKSLKALHRLDLDLKSTGLPAELLLERTVRSIVRGT